MVTPLPTNPPTLTATPSSPLLPTQATLEAMPEAKIIGVGSDPEACKALEKDFKVVAEVKDASQEDQVGG
jgi:hypothetical protein